jgi:hypothetical protein
MSERSEFSEFSEFSERIIKCSEPTKGTIG